MLGLGSDVIANILAAIILAVLGWIISIVLRLPFIYRKRRNLFRFLGITKESPRLVVYLSTVFVRPFGSEDFRGQARSFAGPSTPAAELGTIEPLAALFNDPFLDGLPERLRAWLGERVHWSFQKISPVFLSSPHDRNEVERGNIITVGSQYYNSAGDLYTETFHPILKMEQVNLGMVIRATQGQRQGDLFQQRAGQDDDLAIVEKLHDAATQGTIFFAAGLGVVGTIGAVLFIVHTWERLYRDFGTAPFAICLRFQDIQRDPNVLMRPIELSSFRVG